MTASGEVMAHTTHEEDLERSGHDLKRGGMDPALLRRRAACLPRHVARPGRADHAAASAAAAGTCSRLTAHASAATDSRGGTAWARAIALGTACGT